VDGPGSYSLTRLIVRGAVLAFLLFEAFLQPGLALLLIVLVLGAFLVIEVLSGLIWLVTRRRAGP
jgi:hypothetical protein